MYDALPLLKQSELKFGVFGQQIKIYTGKSFSEALILESVNPQYDKELFIEFPQKIQVQNKLCTNIVLNVKTKIKQKQFLYNF